MNRCYIASKTNFQNKRGRSLNTTHHSALSSTCQLKKMKKYLLCLYQYSNGQNILQDGQKKYLPSMILHFK